MKGKALAIDYGLKRCGIAVTDDDQIIASGLTTVDTKDIFRFIIKYIEENNVVQFVVGDPKDLKGQPQEISRKADEFVEKLQSSFHKIPVARIDERFTSSMAMDALIASGVKKQKRRDKKLIDEVSATIILQSWLDSKGTSTTLGDRPSN